MSDTRTGLTHTRLHLIHSFPTLSLSLYCRCFITQEQNNIPLAHLLQIGYGKEKLFAASLHAIVTVSWCHRQPWHFIHTERLWAHHMCFSIQCIFKCFPGNCFNTICLLGNLVPTNAMPVSLVLFLGLSISAHKCHKAPFSPCSPTYTELSLHLKREGWIERLSCAPDSAH